MVALHDSLREFSINQKAISSPVFSKTLILLHFMMNGFFCIYINQMLESKFWLLYVHMYVYESNAWVSMIRDKTVG